MNQYFLIRNLAGLLRELVMLGNARAGIWSISALNILKACYGERFSDKQIEEGNQAGW